jgi:hypothetical protein
MSFKFFAGFSENQGMRGYSEFAGDTFSNREIRVHPQIA